MKKLFYLVLIIPIFLLSGCGTDKNSENNTNSNNAEEQNMVGNDRDEHGCIGSAGYTWCEQKQKCLRTWEEECVVTENVATSTNESITSDEMGVKVSYYSDESNKVYAKEDGNKLYFYNNFNVDNYKDGQSLELFTKKSETSLAQAIEDKFLNSDKYKNNCYVKVIEETEAYQKAIIDFKNQTPSGECVSGDPSATCDSCPALYSKTNASTYFLFDKSNQEKYFYVSLGQASLIGSNSNFGYGSDDQKEWFNNIEFTK